MSRNVFGWSYPPGAAGDPNAPWNQEDGPCAVCCKPANDCICPECSVCGASGDPECYKPWDSFKKNQHGLRLTRDQVVSRLELEVANQRDKLNEAEQYLSLVQNGGDFSDDLSDQPDPWE